MTSESNEQTPIPGKAHDTLNALDRDRQRLREKLTTPAWYHPLTGALVASIAAAPYFSSSWGFLFVLVIVSILASLRKLGRRRGIVVPKNPTGAKTRVIFGVQIASFFLFLVAIYLLRELEPAWWWLLILMVVAFIVTVVLGRSYDRAQQDELVARA